MVEERGKSLKLYFEVFAAAGVIVLLFVFKTYSYLLFHSMAEVFSVAIAIGIFMLAWSARRILDNGSLLFLGIAYLFVGFLDLLHTLSYSGMGVFPFGSTNLPTQLWITARIIESVSLFLAAFFFRRRIRVGAVVAFYMVFTGLLLVSIFHWKNFPACYIEGSGLTPFKIYSEYALCFILAGSIFTIIRKRDGLHQEVRWLLLMSIAVTIGSELLFTLYSGPYDLFNTLGHFLKIISFYLIYKALINTAIVEPSKVLFRNLALSANSFRTERDRLYSILDSMADGVSIVNDRYVLEYVNPAMERDFGIVQDGIRCFQYMEKRSSQCHGCKLREVLGGERVRYTITAFNEKTYDILETPLYNQDGTVSKLKIFRDITESQKMLDALESSEKKYRSLFENMLDGLAFHEIIVDEKGLPVDYRLLEANASFERITGLKLKEIIGKKVTEILPGIQDDPAGWIKRYGSVALENKEIKFEQFSVQLNKWFSVSAYSTRKNFFCTIFEDITDRKRSEEALLRSETILQQHAVELERANQELESFSYTASHDLRAPLRAVIGFAEFLKEDYSKNLDETANSYIDKICSAGKRMDQLIQDLLGLSRVSRHNLSMNDTDISAMAQQFVTGLNYSESGRDVVFQIQQNMHHQVDRSLMQQVIANLLHNALKYSSHKASAQIEFGRKEKDNEYVYFVHDNGAGFDNQFVSKLFQPFSRLHCDIEFQGTGIGLAIVRRIIERHGGRVWAEGAVGEGATFYFALPAGFVPLP